MLKYIMTNGNNKLRLKEPIMATSIHEDTGFCSEDYMEHELHSPTDSSEDSVEVKVSVITLKQKRKLSEEYRSTQPTFKGPLKKRMCLKMKAEAKETSASGNTPFRPWSPPGSKIALSTVSGSNFAVPFPIKCEKLNVSSVEVNPEMNVFPRFRPTSSEIEPLSLVIKREKEDSSSTKYNSDIRVPIHPQITKLSPAETERMILEANEQFPGLQVSQSSQTSSFEHDIYSSNKKSESKREQRNYKNMTRERRIEANARERTRVHTISAAFDTLRRAVPSYSNNQKLSKLSVLRIACSYIMTLSKLVQDNDDKVSQPSTQECVDLVSRTIQREGKLRKKKDDND